MNEIAGTTKLVGIIGWPLDHSVSPRMQNAAFAALDLDWAYVPLPTPPERLADAVSGLAALGFVGANVTTPHKLAVRALCATDAPSVNTLVVRDDRVEGATTDAAILSTVTARSPAIIGDGGGARAFQHALPHARSFSRRAEWPPAVDDCDLVVNATSERDGVLVVLGAGQTLVDLPYPETATARAARRAGASRDRRPRCPRRARSGLVRALDGRPGADRRDAGGRRLTRVTLELRTAGESHGPALVAIVSGLPAGLELDREAIDDDLRRRQEGYGRSPRQKLEQDQVEVLAGLRHGRTLGSPLALRHPQPRSRKLGVGDEPVAARRRRDWQGHGSCHAASPGTCRSRGSAQVRPRRHARCARASERAADRRSGRSRSSRESAAARDRRGGRRERPRNRREARKGEWEAATDAARSERDTLGGIVEVVAEEFLRASGRTRRRTTGWMRASLLR